MAFGAKKKDGVYLRPRVRRVTPLMDIGLAVIVGAISGVYIFNDTFRKWQDSEGMLAQEIGSASKPVIPGVVQHQQKPSSQASASTDRT